MGGHAPQHTKVGIYTPPHAWRHQHRAHTSYHDYKMGQELTGISRVKNYHNGAPHGQEVLCSKSTGGAHIRCTNSDSGTAPHSVPWNTKAHPDINGQTMVDKDQQDGSHAVKRLHHAQHPSSSSHPGSLGRMPGDRYPGIRGVEFQCTPSLYPNHKDRQGERCNKAGPYRVNV